MQGMQQNDKSPLFDVKNTSRIESNLILQPPMYLIIFVNQFIYMNKNVTENRCSKLMDTIITRDPYQLSLQATIHYHGHFVF